MTSRLPVLSRTRPADLADLGRLEVECFPEEQRWDEELLAACARRTPGRLVLVARESGDASGYIACRMGGGLHVDSVAVRPARARRGVGSALMKAAHRWGERMGAAGATLEVRVSAAGPRAFYAALGYREAGIREGYYGDGETAVVLRRPLEPDPLRAELAGELLRRLGTVPPVGVVLGSGLAWLVDLFGGGRPIPLSELPGIEWEDLPGHPGGLVASGCGRFVFLMGRRHHYQGFDCGQISMLPAALADLGVDAWLLTSSSGAVDPDLEPGDAVVFRDHVNLAGVVPERPDGSCGGEVYDRRLGRLAMEAAGRVGAPVREGVFACVSGPAYETSADIRLLQRSGVTTVSMSTAPEALHLASSGCRVAGLSLVTNAAAPGSEVTHDEVLASQTFVRRKQEAFLAELLTGMASGELQGD